MLPEKLFLVFFCLYLIQVQRAAQVQAGSNIYGFGGLPLDGSIVFFCIQIFLELLFTGHGPGFFIVSLPFPALDQTD